MTISVADLEAAGLYDPAAPDAAERLALIEWLVERGATVEQMVRRLRTGSLFDVAGELGRARGECLTLAEVSAKTGLPIERIESIRFASGLPALGPDDPAVTEDEARSFSVFVAAEPLFGRAAVRRFTQVLGAALARAAEAAVSVSVASLMEPIVRRGGSDVELAEARFRSAASTAPLADAVAQLFLVHVEDAVSRLAPRSRPLAGSLATSPLAVGFIDLVGFTPLARQIEPGALGAFIDRFEETAHDVAIGRGGRIVKFIGDEVMFVTAEAGAACDIALTLVERFAGDDTVTPRGAVAAGRVLLRGGDYYGPTVNLAARMAQLAVPAEILVTEGVAAEAGGAGLRFEPAGRRVLKGFDAPVRVLTVERAEPAA
jgi:class 3 adenylate cyclase